MLLSMTLPARAADIVDTLCGYGEFDVLCELIGSSGLDATLRERAPLTVFAPDDRAFARMDAGELAALRRPANREMLRKRLLYHVVPARLDAFTLRQERPASPIEGKRVRFVLMHDQVMINDAFIDTEDIAASNGLIHSIDKVLSPDQ